MPARPMLRIVFVEAGDELCSIGPACDTGYDESPKVMPDSAISHRLVTTDVLVSQNHITVAVAAYVELFGRETVMPSGPSFA